MTYTFRPFFRVVPPAAELVAEVEAAADVLDAADDELLDEEPHAATTSAVALASATAKNDHPIRRAAGRRVTRCCI
jgi:hypothetical protein